MDQSDKESQTKTSSVIQLAKRLGTRTLSSLRGTASERSPEDLDSVFKQHPDLFRDSAEQNTEWSDFAQAAIGSTTSTLLIRQAQTPAALREYLLCDTRMQLCAVAERLSDACLQIRKQSYSVVVFAIGERFEDMLPLLELMNHSNPRAKAVAVLEPQVTARLQNMIHPKVLGYVAAQDAAEHLADTVIEVSHGRFTASPEISQAIMMLTSKYLAPGLTQAQATRQTAAALQPTASVQAQAEPVGMRDSSFFMSSNLPSGFDSMSNFPKAFLNARAQLSEREIEILALIAGGLSSAGISDQLAISVPTVNTHIRNIFTKLGVRTRAQAIHQGISQGLIQIH